jgi:molybdopterin-guanine dinucleotide biosynthesis protein A
MYLYLIQRLKEACPDLNVFHVSLRDRDALVELQQSETISMTSDTTAVPRGDETVSIQFLFDQLPTQTNDRGAVDIGPAAGLLAAHYEDSTTNWLIVACDFPLLTASTLCLLVREFHAPLTCYRNTKGFCEPLLAIWSPEALEKLEENTKHGNYGPRFVVEELPAKIIRAERGIELFNANTVEEWRAAMKVLELSTTTSKEW